MTIEGEYCATVIPRAATALALRSARYHESPVAGGSG